MEIDEKTKQALEKLRKMNIESLVDGYISLMLKLAEFMKSWGEVEKEHGDFIEQFNIISKSPALLNAFIEKASPEVTGLTVKFFIRMAAIGPRVEAFMTLSPEDKIKLGEELKKTIEEYQQLLKLLEKKQ